MGRGRDRDAGRPVEPGKARAHGNDPNAVEYHRAGDHPEGLGPDIPRQERTTGGSGSIADEAFRDTGDRDYRDDRVYRGAGEGRRYGDEGRSRVGRSHEGHENRRDSIRWGPIWAGLLTALTTYLLLQLLAIGAGLQEVGPDNQGGGGWVSAIIGLVAFFTGGAVAGMTSAVRGAATGLLNGFMVWALGTVLILVLSALGLGQILGALGNVVGQVGQLANPQQVQGAAQGVSPQEAADAVRTGSIGAFFGLLLSALAAMLGGYLGGRSDEPIGRMADDR